MCLISLQIIECLLHLFVTKLNLGSDIYIMSHYTAGVILYGKREEVTRQKLSKVNNVLFGEYFDHYYYCILGEKNGNAIHVFLVLIYCEVNLFVCGLQVNFDQYKAIISFVNIGNVHWKFLVSTAQFNLSIVLSLCHVLLNIL